MRYKVVAMNTRWLDAEFEVDAESEEEAYSQAEKKLDDIEFTESLFWDFGGDEEVFRMYKELL